MVNVVNTQALASSVAAGKSPTQTEKPDAEQLFKELDTGNKGYLTADDLQAAVVKISAEGAKRAESAGQSAPSAADLLAKTDGDGDGQVTLDEFKAAEPKAPPSGGGAGGAQGAAPSGGQAPAGAAGGSAASSSATTYEPADVNEDGQVSAKEQADYDAKLAAEKAAAQAASNSRTAEADAAVKAYESVEQLGKAASAS